MKNMKKNKSIIKNLHPSIKIATVIFLNLVIVFAPETIRSCILDLFISLFLVSITNTFHLVSKMKYAIFVILISTIVMWSVSYPGNREFMIASIQGGIYGSLVAVKLVSILLISLTFVYSTTPDEIIDGLTYLKIPYKFSYVMSDAMQLIPLILEKYQVVSDVFALRGYRYKSMKFKEKLGFFGKQILIVLCSVFKDMEGHALALELKGYGCTKRRTRYKAPEIHKKDIILLLFLVVIGTFYYF